MHPKHVLAFCQLPIQAFWTQKASSNGNQFIATGNFRILLFHSADIQLSDLQDLTLKPNNNSSCFPGATCNFETRSTSLQVAAVQALLFV